MKLEDEGENQWQGLLSEAWFVVGSNLNSKRVGEVATRKEENIFTVLCVRGMVVIKN